jgi:hypothetical protein
VAEEDSIGARLDPDLLASMLTPSEDSLESYPYLNEEFFDSCSDPELVSSMRTCSRLEDVGLNTLRAGGFKECPSFCRCFSCEFVGTCTTG